MCDKFEKAEQGGAGEPLIPIENLNVEQRNLYDYLCMEEAAMNIDRDMTTIARGIFRYVRHMTKYQARCELNRRLR